MSPLTFAFPGCLFYDLKKEFYLDLSWDCYDGPPELYCWPNIPSDSYNSKIVAFGARTVAPPSGILILPWEYLHDHYSSDGVVPIQSALFYGKTLQNLYTVDGDCDHSQIYKQDRTCSGTPIFAAIASETTGRSITRPNPGNLLRQPSKFHRCSPATDHPLHHQRVRLQPQFKTHVQ